MQEAYPVDNAGMPLRVDELNLRPSRLQPIRTNQSEHHYFHSEADYTDLLIPYTLRNLRGEQVRMQNDQHNLGRAALHHIFDAPPKPSLEQMMDRLDIAKQNEEQMRIRADGRWILQRISNIHWLQIDQEYNREKD